MKTAMQELKEWYEETPPQTRFGVMYGKIISLLEKEKQQIKDAWDNGDKSIDPIDAEDYYTQTYTP
jgi:hypothetical protein